MEQTNPSGHPLTKLQLFREVKKSILGAMNRDELTAERAGGILKVVEQKIREIRHPGEVKGLCVRLSEEFPELAILKKKLELKEEEQLDDLVRMVVEEVVIKGDLALAAVLFDELAAVGNDQQKILLRLQSLCPIELKAVRTKEKST